MTRHRPLPKAQTCKVSETKCLFEAKHLHRRLSGFCFRLVSVMSWSCSCCLGDGPVNGAVTSLSCLGRLGVVVVVVSGLSR